jgi:hypothetical protein
LLAVGLISSTPKLQAAFALQGCKLAKLFAKHFKVGEQQQALQSSCANIATGNAARLVLEPPHLHVSQTPTNGT